MKANYHRLKIIITKAYFLEDARDLNFSLVQNNCCMHAAYNTVEVLLLAKHSYCRTAIHVHG